MRHHDLTYRLLFSYPRMIEHLVRGFVREPWVERLDFSSLERLNASYVSEDRQSREGDLVWRLRLRGPEPAFVYVLLEFQSGVERYMALRMMVYEGLLYQQLLKQGDLEADGRLPLVLLLVVYNGRGRWSAPHELAELVRRVDETSTTDVPRLRYRLIDATRAREGREGDRNLVSLVFRLEASRDRREVSRVTGLLAGALRGPDDGDLRRAFLVWIRRVLLPGRREGKIPAIVGLEEFRTMLEKTVQRWNRELREEGREEGRLEGLRETRKQLRELLLVQIERRFGPVDGRIRARLRAAGLARLKQWGERFATAERLEDVFAPRNGKR